MLTASLSTENPLSKEEVELSSLGSPSHRNRMSNGSRGSSMFEAPSLLPMASSNSLVEDSTSKDNDGLKSKSALDDPTSVSRSGGDSSNTSPRSTTDQSKLSDALPSD
jgi:hypothetical protein